jgi:lipoate-protein ligase A
VHLAILWGEVAMFGSFSFSNDLSTLVENFRKEVNKNLATGEKSINKNSDANKDTVFKRIDKLEAIVNFMERGMMVEIGEIASSELSEVSMYSLKKRPKVV